MKVFIAFMFLLTSVNANAEIALPEFIQPSPNQDMDFLCRKGVALADKSLADAQVASSTVGGSAVGSLPSSPAGLAAPAGAQQVLSEAQAKANATAAGIYKSGLQACMDPCLKSFNRNMEMGTAGNGSTGGEGVSPGPSGQAKITLEKNAATAKKAMNDCEAAIEQKLRLVQVAQAQGLVQAPEAKTVKDVATGTPGAKPAEEESWFQRNGAWVVGAGLVGVGAAALLSNSGGSSGGQQYQNSPSPSPSPTPATGTGTVCTTEAEATTETCAATFVTNCTATPSGTGCATFTSNYCGLADASSVTPSGSGAGNKTTYCRSVVSTRFCAQTGTSACVTCEYQAQMSKAICKTNIENNPTLCASQNTQTQIDAKKAACPSDPVYADNSILQTTAPNAGLDAPVLPTGTTSTVTGTGSGTGTGVYTGKYYSSDAEKKSGLAASSASGTASRGVASTGSTSVSSGGYGSYATASVYKGAASEITPTMGRNLFDKNSKTLQNWCYSVQCRNVGAAAN